MQKYLMLIMTIFLFSGCKDPEPIEVDKLVYVYKKQPNLKNLNRIDTTLPPFKLFKKQHPNEPDMYIVDKAGLLQASKNTQSLRKIVHDLNYQTKFYVYQNNKFNKLNQQTNKEK